MSTRGRGSGGDHASRGIPRGQAQVGAFGRDDPQRGPSEREQVLFDAGEQLIIEVGEYGERQVLSRRGHGLRTDAADQFSLIDQHGEETVEFGLYGPARGARNQQLRLTKSSVRRRLKRRGSSTWRVHRSPV